MKTFVATLGLGMLWGTGVSPIAASAPSNDNFIDRIPILGTNVSVTGINTNATKESREPDHAGNQGGQSVWWTWQAPENGEVRINTDGSDFDTLLAVYLGSRVSALSLVASNDDHGLFATSRVRFQTIKGTNYEIAVDGFRQGPDVASGNITLNLVFMRDPILRPANDLFTNRVFLPGSSVSVDGSNTNATREPAEPLHAEGFGDASVWWSWTAPATRLVVVSTEGSTFDTLLGIYSGTTLASLTIVTNSDDIDPVNNLFTSQAIFQAVAGRSYEIAVDGFDGAMGWIHLAIGPLLLRLGPPTLLSDGRFQFTVTGPPGVTNGIELSTDLRSWIPLNTVVNEFGTVTFVDSPSTLSGNRFYRATVGP